MLTLDLPIEIEQQIQQRAVASGSTANDYLREMLVNLFKKEETLEPDANIKSDSWNREFGETTISAMQEAKKRQGKRYETIDEAMTALLAD